MSRLQKLVARFLADPPELRFEDVRSLLEGFGFEQDRSRGSHHVFVEVSGSRVIVVPTRGGRTVGRAYVRIIARLLDLEAWHESNT